MLIDISQLKFTKDVYGIIHIGAHECEERSKYLRKFNNVTDNEIIWIDALKNKVDAIKRGNPTIRIFNECISNKDNEDITFHVTNNLQSSSILNLKEHLIEHPDIYEIEQIEMKTKTLKTFYNENNFEYNQFNFMALDIQGAELMALEGADEIITFVDYIYIEVNTKELYENGAKLEEIEKYLHKFNFVRQTIYMTDHGWGDAFYVKNIFDISDNFTIEYGVDNIKNDITDVVFEKSFANNIIHIPNLDGIRGNLYGDPLFGIVKKIFINSGNNTFTIEHDVFVNIDIINHKLYINENISQKKYNYNFTIMAIFKNETMNLKVWLDHYLWQGIEHFYLIDNDSNDNPINILQEYIDKGIVTYYFKPEKHQQAQHYRTIFDIENLKEKTKWLCICDLDEFFFGTEKKLFRAVDEFDGYDVIYTHSFFYGSDNLINQPKDIRTSIIHRTDDIVNGIKYIFKPSSINNSSEIWIHWLVESGTLQKKIGQNETFTDTKIRLNHYLIQSLEYYQNVKMIRGDVSVLENENRRDMNYFEHYQNISIIKDDILKNIIENDLYDKNGEIMKFYDEHNNLIDNNSIEKPEQDLVNHYILEDDIVLELGARYGTVSCAINKKLNNKFNQISIEPDETVWYPLEMNKIKNNCNFNIVKGFVSNKKLGLTQDGYGSTFIIDDKTQISSHSLDEIKTKYIINKFTALVADCEGFLEVFFDENPNLFAELRIIIFEADYADKCNYDKIKHNLFNNNFIKIIEGHQNVWIKKNN
jgi:FkbM family methyltransferase